VTWIGTVTPTERKILMAGAELMITPTLYVGPFEGVHVESLLSGVPVIAPNYGVFTETLPREWRYTSMASAVQAAEIARHARLYDGERIRQDAIARFSLDAAAKMYDRWFHQLDTLRGGGLGWYA
jgi:glycosyltransferase involved in cell wall biosynthesis